MSNPNWQLQPWKPQSHVWVIQHLTCPSRATCMTKVYGCPGETRCHACGEAPPKHLLVGLRLLAMGDPIYEE